MQRRHKPQLDGAHLLGVDTHPDCDFKTSNLHMCRRTDGNTAGRRGKYGRKRSRTEGEQGRKGTGSRGRAATKHQSMWSHMVFTPDGEHG